MKKLKLTTGDKKSPVTKTKKIVLVIEGMHCASCASNVEKIVKKVKGVKDITVSVMTHKGFVEADDNVDEEEMKKAVSKVGYKVTEVEKE